MLSNGMRFKEIYALIPDSFRKRGVLVSVSLFFRALLDFAGVVVFIPVLARVLEKEGSVESVLPAAGAAMAFILLKSWLSVLLAKYRSRYVFSLYTALADSVMRKFLSRGLLFIRQSNSVDLANKVNAVTMTFTSGILLSFLNAMSSLLLLLIILAALFIYEPLPTLALLLVIGPFMFFYSFYVRNSMKKLGVEENRARRGQARKVLEMFRGYPEYCINGAAERQLSSFLSELEKVGDVRLKTESYSAASSGFMEITIMLSIVILMMLSMSGPWGMSMTFGIFALSAMKILPSVRSIVASWQAMQSSSYSIDILKDILMEPGAMDRRHSSTDRQEKITFSRDISLRGVSFRYGGPDSYIFRDLDLTIGKGEYVGIKGRSGAGKTTLFNLLMGFYTPEEGGLYVDDTRIGPENIGAWQSLLGYVPQDVFLVDGTFVENVAFGEDASAADRARIEHIFRRTGLWDWVSGLPEGMDTRLAEAGNSISGGQRQRIGIARALYKGASVLFFDEATSSVDLESETQINSFISELSADDTSLTVVVIAHRQETLGSCRRIIDLDRLVAKHENRR